MRSTVSSAIRRAVLVALAPACSSGPIAPVDGGADAQSIDSTTSDVNAGDAADAGDEVDDSSIAIPDVQPPPGCFLTGKPDGFAPCGYTELMNDPDVCQVDTLADSGTQDPNVCYHLCSWDEPDCYYYELPPVDDGGEAGYYLTCGAGCIGRLHDDARADVATTCAHLHARAGDFLADAARLEAASVDAFEIVARELEAFGAPAELSSAAREAANEERRHARVVSKLASRRGASVALPATPTRRTRDLRAFAIENAIEGCVRETYGAALATFQASSARAADVRAAMREIARDESSHASLSFRIDEWLRAHLDAGARAELDRARASAIDALESHITTAPRRSFADELGLPERAEALAMLHELRRSVWS